MRSFDAIAGQFEQLRAWPPEVSAQLRQALLSGGELPAGALILEIGCGTGRVGRSLCRTGDRYHGLDHSLEMLGEFRREQASAMLVCAEGAQLPFGEAQFDLSLLMQVIGPRADWQELLAEAMRVLRPGGVLALGRRERAADSLEARLNRKLNQLLPAVREDAARNREGARGWLRARSRRHHEMLAASWSEHHSARQFIERKRSAARFRALPEAVQEEALATLRRWAGEEMGELDQLWPQAQGLWLEFYWPK